MSAAAMACCVAPGAALWPYGPRAGRVFLPGPGVRSRRPGRPGRWQGVAALDGHPCPGRGLVVVAGRLARRGLAGVGRASSCRRGCWQGSLPRVLFAWRPVWPGAACLYGEGRLRCVVSWDASWSGRHHGGDVNWWPCGPVALCSCAPGGVPAACRGLGRAGGLMFRLRSGAVPAGRWRCAGQQLCCGCTCFRWCVAGLIGGFLGLEFPAVSGMLPVAGPVSGGCGGRGGAVWFACPGKGVYCFSSCPGSRGSEKPPSLMPVLLVFWRVAPVLFALDCLFGLGVLAGCGCCLRTQ